MRPEKKAILDEIQGALEKSTFVVLTEFRGLKVDQMTQLVNYYGKANGRWRPV